jgi:hypothetical protein
MFLLQTMVLESGFSRLGVVTPDGAMYATGTQKVVDISEQDISRKR